MSQGHVPAVISLDVTWLAAGPLQGILHWNYPSSFCRATFIRWWQPSARLTRCHWCYGSKWSPPYIKSNQWISNMSQWNVDLCVQWGESCEYPIAIVTINNPAFWCFHYILWFSQESVWILDCMRIIWNVHGYCQILIPYARCLKVLLQSSGQQCHRPFYSPFQYLTEWHPIW